MCVLRLCSRLTVDTTRVFMQCSVGIWPEVSVGGESVCGVCNPAIIRIGNNCRIRKVKNLICVRRLCQNGITPGSTGVRFRRSHCISIPHYLYTIECLV